VESPEKSNDKFYGLILCHNSYTTCERHIAW